MSFGKQSLFSLGDTTVERSASKWLFLIGLGSLTQINIGGYTAISEFFLVLMLPINILKNSGLFKRDKVTVAIGLLLFWLLGAIFTDFYNDTIPAARIRGMIPSLGLLSSLVGIYPLLKKNPRGLKWLLVGAFLSSIVSIFIFQAGSDVGREAVRSGDMSAAEAVMGYKLFWVSRVEGLLTLPIKGWYFETPMWLTVLAMIGLSVFGLYSGGRSSFAITALCLILILIGGKDYDRIRKIKKHIPILLVILFSMAVAFKATYRYAATSGWMGEEERAKYEYQTKGGDDFLHLLMSGRSEFFVGLIAALDSPLIGHGTYAVDNKNYYLNFIVKYGDAEDIKSFLIATRDKLTLIPAHSQLAMFWCWHGLPGLLFWVYFGYLLMITLLRRMDAIPYYFGYLALTIPSAMWALLFSPLGNRVNMGGMIAVLLFVAAENRKRSCPIFYRGK